MGNKKKLKKELGLLDVFSISTGAMFSSGFFLLPGIASQYTGPSIFLAYLVAGILIIPSMLSIAEISTALPRSGGTYFFLDRSLGPMMGTIGGIGSYFAIVLKTTFAIVGIGAYTLIFFDVPVKMVAIASTLFFMIFNLISTKNTSKLQNFFVSVLVIILTVFILDGIYNAFFSEAVSSKEVLKNNFSPLFTQGFTGIITTAGFVFVSYLGLTEISSVAEEIKNPEKNIPLGMVLSLLVTGAIYVLGVFVMVAVINPDKLSTEMAPAATAAAELFKWLPENAGGYLMIGAAMAAFASTGNAGLMSSSRFPMAMGRDKLLPKTFAKVGNKGTPVAAIILTTAFIIVFIIFLTEEGIVKLASTFQLVIFIFINFAVIVFRQSNISSYDPGYKSPLYPAMQIVGIIVSFILIIYMGWTTILLTTAIIGLGYLYFYFYAKKKVKREGAIFHWFALLGKNQNEDLESEFMGILKEKGLRHGDPFDKTIIHAKVTRLDEILNFEELTTSVSEQFAEELKIESESLIKEFYATSPIEPALVIPGVSILYAKDKNIKSPALHIVLCNYEPGIRKPVHKGAISSEDYIRIFFFLINPKDQPRQQLRMLSRLVDIVERGNFHTDVMETNGERALKEYLLHNERYTTVELLKDSTQEELIGKKLMEIKLPQGVLVALIERNGETITPSGQTLLQENDVLTIIGEPKAINSLIHKYFGKP